MEKFMTYKHLSQQQRYQIQYYLSENLSQRKIATILGINHSTISREIARNATTQRRANDDKYITKYDANSAQTKYISRRSRNRSKATDNIIRIIKEDMKQFNSITSIVGRRRLDDVSFPSATTIYHWVKQGVLILSKAYKNAFKLKQSNYTGRSNSKECDEHTKTIHERSTTINKRTKFGHWELDLIESAGDGGYIISLIERVTRFTLTKYIENKTIKNVNKFISSVMKKYAINSITTDNGKEFLQLHKLKSNKNPLEIYYCDPGAPYQKGQVEWFNKQMRRFIKKKSVITNKSIRKIKHYTNIINNKYLNVLNYHCPAELEHYIKK